MCTIKIDTPTNIKGVRIMEKLITRTLAAARNYTIWDYGFLKIALISAGILLGSYFSQFFLENLYVLWSVFIVSYVWIIYKTFMK